MNVTHFFSILFCKICSVYTSGILNLIQTGRIRRFLRIYKYYQDRFLCNQNWLHNINHMTKKSIPVWALATKLVLLVKLKDKCTFLICWITMKLSYVAQTGRQHTWQGHHGNRVDRMVVCGHSSLICSLVFKIGNSHSSYYKLTCHQPAWQQKPLGEAHKIHEITCRVKWEKKTLLTTLIKKPPTTNQVLYPAPYRLSQKGWQIRWYSWLSWFCRTSGQTVVLTGGHWSWKLTGLIPESREEPLKSASTSIL